MTQGEERSAPSWTEYHEAREPRLQLVLRNGAPTVLQIGTRLTINGCALARSKTDGHNIRELSGGLCLHATVKGERTAEAQWGGDTWILRLSDCEIYPEPQSNVTVKAWPLAVAEKEATV